MPKNLFCYFLVKPCQCPMTFLFVFGKLRCLLHDHSVCLEELHVLWLHDHFSVSVFPTNCLPNYAMWWKGSPGLCFPCKGFIMNVSLFFHRKRFTLWNLAHFCFFKLQKSLKIAYISIGSALWVAIAYHKWLGPLSTLYFEILEKHEKYMKISLWQTSNNIYFIPEPFLVRDLPHRCYPVLPFYFVI